MGRFKQFFPYIYAAALAGGFYWFFLRRTNLLWERGKYTVGYVTGRVAGGKSASSVSYRYSVAGVTYTGGANEKKGMLEKAGTRYPVVYDSLEPSVSDAYFDRSLSDSFRNVPATGWSKRTFNALTQADSLRQARLAEQPDSLP